MMGDVIIFNDESIDFIWNTIQNQQIIFRPEIAPEGKIKYDIFAATKRRKTFTLFVDRNILSSLLKFCEIGSLKNKGESQLIGVIMAWQYLMICQSVLEWQSRNELSNYVPKKRLGRVAKISLKYLKYILDKCGYRLLKGS